MLQRPRLTCNASLVRCRSAYRVHVGWIGLIPQPSFLHNAHAQVANDWVSAEPGVCKKTLCSSPWGSMSTWAGCQLLRQTSRALCSVQHRMSSLRKYRVAETHMGQNSTCHPRCFCLGCCQSNAPCFSLASLWMLSGVPSPGIG
jgi:hypothetical protein